MKTGRLEAFSDGVLAIVITIMVLELVAPEGSEFSDLKPLYPKFLSYLLSFVYLGIYWNNHHHLFQAIERVNGKILWANLTLLFILSLIPFTTAWMGENHFAKNPVALYGINLLLSAVSFLILEKAAINHEGRVSKIGRALKDYVKEYFSIGLYVGGTVAAFYIPLIGIICFATVAAIWIIPDSRIEKQLK
ncbi:MAG TPA: TMEM175 family protein [Prolixibacteraceae bacterium]|nr:TMEM175 family protein [Prolixibacteraceae bacterium]